MTNIASGPLTSLAFCWRLERRDGGGVALTSHDQPLWHDGVRYDPAPGMIPASVVRRRGLDAPSGEIDGAISSAALTEFDLEMGRWDGATIRLLAVDWTAPGGQALPLMAGEIGGVSVSGGGFTAELSGAMARLDAPACPATSPECRAELGDRDCRVDLSARRLRASVVAQDGNALTLSILPGDGYVAGSLSVMSGTLTGFRSPILGVAGAVLTLRDPPRATIAVGTRVWLVEGCDKRFATCRDRFANAPNFRGEPHLPGNDLLTRYPGA